MGWLRSPSTVCGPLSGTTIGVNAVRATRCRHCHNRVPHGCCDTDGIWIVACAALYTVSGRQECVKSLDEIGVPCEK